MRCRAMVVSGLFASSLAHAGSTVSVQLSPEGDMLAQQLGVTPAELAMQIKQRVDAAYQTENIDGFLQAFTDATSFSARGIGTDYASAPRGAIAGVGVNFAIAGNGDVTAAERPTTGLAANVAVMAGLNLAEWQHPGWTIYANGFYRSAATEQLDGDILSAGAHVQYRLLDPTESGGTGTALRWIGVILTSGIEYTRWSLHSGSRQISTDFAVSGSSGGATLALRSTGMFDLTSNATTVPIEATTGIRVALIASLYVGGALDVTVGNSTLDASLNGHMATSDGRDVGTVAIAASGSHAGSPGSARLLAGAQLNLWKVKLFFQLNVAQTPAASVGFGIRFVQ